MKLATQFREALEKAEADAAAKWTAFDDLRKKAVEAGVDLTAKDSDDYAKIEEAHKSYAVVADEVGELRSRLMDALKMDGDAPPEPRQNDDDDRGTKAEIWTPGQRVVESADYKAVLDSGVLESEAKIGNIALARKALSRAEYKTLLTGLSRTSAGAFIEPDRQAGFYPVLTRPIAVRNLVTVGDTDSDIVEWVKENSFTNAAAETAEATSTAAGGTKPESGIDYAVVQSTVRNIAHWIPATKRALADVGQLRTLIDARLGDGIALRLDSQMINGDATGENLRGILNTSGIGTVAKGAEPSVETILSAITTIRLTFLEPNAILLHPSDFQDIRVAKNANGEYFYGPPNIAGPAQAWGLPIITSAVIPAGTGLVGKFDEAILWVREGVTISASDSHSDFFVRNMVAVLGESRVAFAVPRPAAFCSVTGI